MADPRVEELPDEETKKPTVEELDDSSSDESDAEDMSSHIHAAVHHGFQGLLGFVLLPSSSPSRSCAAAASKSFSQ